MIRAAQHAQPRTTAGGGTRVPSRGPRRGLSLLEVLLALAILATATMLLSQLVQMALRSAAISRDQPRAVMWCESRLAEISAGILPPTSVESAPLPEDLEWVYSVQSQPGAQPGILEVTVTVQRDTAMTSTASVSLTRWIIDPNDQRFIPEADAATELGSTSP